MKPDEYISACWAIGVVLEPRPDGGLAIRGEYPEDCLRYGKKWKHRIRPLLLAGVPRAIEWKQDGAGWVAVIRFVDAEGPNVATGIGETREAALDDLMEQADGGDPFLIPSHRMMVFALCAIEAGLIEHWEGEEVGQDGS